MIWTILGVALGVAGAFCIVASELLRAWPVLDGWRGVIATVLAAFGATVGLTGMFWRRAHPEIDEETRQSLAFKLGRPFWGAMLLAGAGIALFIQPLRTKEAAVAPPPPARPAPPPVVKAEPPPVTNAPMKFPALKIQGVILVGDQPVVLIDGEAFGVGDQVQGVTVKSVTREGVVMELRGETKKYKVP
jgi:hypothetical protein